MRRHLFRSLATTVTAAMIACSGGDGSESSQEAMPAPPGVSGHAPVATQGIPSVVTLDPPDGASASLPAEPAMMDQLSLSFMPNTLMVRPGQTVLFTNSETLAHNVHVRPVASDSTIFVEDMVPGGAAALTLEQEGGYDVTCDEHPGMRAFIYVTSARYAAFADVDGNFLIPDVPRGTYTASVWSATPDLRSQREVTVSGTSTVLDLLARP